jgi:hypothetical protein
MEKMMEEEELKGLEEEIDDAVDRLFVAKKGGKTDSFLMESPPAEPPLKTPAVEPTIKSPAIAPSMEPSISEPYVKPVIPAPTLKPPIPEPPRKPPIPEPPMKSLVLEPLIEPSISESADEMGKIFDLEITPPPPPLPTVPTPFLKSIEKMEAQLLSLEWEITEEKLKRTGEEVLALRDLMKQKPDITSILSWMDKVLAHMIKNEENIRPPWIKFLLDSKETIKLLMKKDTEGEINIYKQLAYHGIEARFFCLEGMKEAPVLSPPMISIEEKAKEEIFLQAEKRIEDTLNKMNLFSGKMDEILGKIEPYLSKMVQMNSKIPEPFDDRSLHINVTIFKVDEKLLGVESKNVFKLFKVPNTFQEKYSNQQKVRLKDVEVKMINLKELLSIHGGGPKEEIRILTVKDNGEFKGFMVDQVLKKLSTVSDQEGKVGEYFSGVIHFTYQEQSVEIPILDLKKF